MIAVSVLCGVRLSAATTVDQVMIDGYLPDPALEQEYMAEMLKTGRYWYMQSTVDDASGSDSWRWVTSPDTPTHLPVRASSAT